MAKSRSEIVELLSIDARRSRRVDLVLRALWSVNVATLIGLIAWAYFDARFPGIVNALKWDVTLFGSTGQLLPNNPDRYGGVAILCLLVLAATSGLAIFAGLFIGPPAHRLLRSWFGLMALIAAWLALWTNWSEIAWLGQQRRVRSELAEFESLAASLRADWPAQDGERPPLGPFMAYPIGRTTVLLLLSPPKLPNNGIQFAAIEHHPDGGLCFQLSGAESGAWLEWHPSGKRPESFTGGLMTDYRLARSTQIAPEWFLVRYFELSTHELEPLRSDRSPAPQ